ncbi:hypothetical protein SISSUDRAFT_1063599 [Sistotremastrum suecicum HHB10207 ss-3]|uniref:Uncharacterized protein n=1 Tax=Sistotremastrum suecicum HHB10207 ss-3 TaxID=1314776 RepID=A0A166BLG6_9AGAM|nr:hypothetical protein SISSUDRAFT_1063599 [Sistotremastrum suecicum HHB10207 ss-3]
MDQNPDSKSGPICCVSFIALLVLQVNLVDEISNSCPSVFMNESTYQNLSPLHHSVPAFLRSATPAQAPAITFMTRFLHERLRYGAQLLSCNTNLVYVLQRFRDRCFGSPGRRDWAKTAKSNRAQIQSPTSSLPSTLNGIDPHLFTPLARLNLSTSLNALLIDELHLDYVGLRRRGMLNPVHYNSPGPLSDLCGLSDKMGFFLSSSRFVFVAIILYPP